MVAIAPPPPLCRAMALLRLFAITDPWGVECTIGSTCGALGALRAYINEGYGRRACEVRRGVLWFRDAAQQAECAGRWLVGEQRVNGERPPAVAIEIAPPLEPE